MTELFKGFPYPITGGSKGFFGALSGVDQIKADLLILLLTNPGERVYLPEFGTPLRDLLFDPNDDTVAARARQIIIDSISRWENRVSIDQLSVSTKVDRNILNRDDDLTESEGILTISIQFRDFANGNITETQFLELEVPLPGG